MAETDSTRTRPAADGFERYYAEKLWEWIPEVHRDRDGRAEFPGDGTLRALVELVAGQAAVIRRDIDRLWDDQQIALADDWAVAYIGDLLGTRPVSEQNRRGQRVAVARTLFYRRRKGTPVVLEALIRDIADLDGAVVEGWRRLGRTRHRLDPEIAGLAGPVTRTPPGGTADLRSARVSDILDGPFDDLAHTLDTRRLRGPQGRYNIPKANFHLYRLQAFPLTLTTPVDLDEQRFTLDPSGRDIQLFQPRNRPDTGEVWEPVREWQVPMPLTCRRLNAARFRLDTADIPLGLADEIGAYAGFEYRTEAAFRAMLEARLTPLQLLLNRALLLEAALTGTSPKRFLWPGAVALAIGESAAGPLARAEALGADLATWAAGVTVEDDRRALVDPARGRVWLPEPVADGEALFALRHHVGLVAPVGAGPFDRAAALAGDAEVTDTWPAGAVDPDGFFTDPGPVAGTALPATGTVRVPTSKTYVPAGLWVLTGDLAVEAADGERPYIRLDAPEADPAVTIDAGEGPRDLVLDGLWLGIRPDLAPVPLAAASDPCPVVPARLVLDGHFGRVVIRHCTLDPGGEQARTDPLACTPIPAVTLEIRGQVDRLLIDRCITGPIAEATETGDPCSARQITVCDSIVQSIDPATPAITSRIAAVEILRSTVFGDVTVNRLDASDTIVAGLVRVTDNQSGCFRFSATDAHPDRRLPRQYESHVIAPAIPAHAFVSRRLGDGAYAQLSPTAPPAILTGGENRAEMGVFNRRLLALRTADLEAKTREFLPFGLIAQQVFET